jgi:hypothetical protein
MVTLPWSETELAAAKARCTEMLPVTRRREGVANRLDRRLLPDEGGQSVVDISARYREDGDLEALEEVAGAYRPMVVSMARGRWRGNGNKALRRRDLK